MQEQVERSAHLLLACTRKHLPDEVLSILGEDWGGDEGDDLSVVVDVDSGLAIS